MRRRPETVKQLRRVVKLAQRRKGVCRADVVKALGVTARRATHLLGVARAEGHIRRSGERSQARYHG